MRQRDIPMEISKSDWKLFKERLPHWQERYMEHLIEEYVLFLKSDKTASTKFWELEKQIKEDKRHPGVWLSLEKKNVVSDLMRLLKDGVIDENDLVGFSPELKDRVSMLSNIEW
jgi:hypothetical protein